MAAALFRAKERRALSGWMNTQGWQFTLNTTVYTTSLCTHAHDTYDHLVHSHCLCPQRWASLSLQRRQASPTACGRPQHHAGSVCMRALC